MRALEKRGQLRLIYLVVAAFLILTTFAFIQPFKETLNNVRGSISLNCPGTPNFNQTQYSTDGSLNQLTRRPVCFVTGISLVYFIGTVLISISVWAVARWKKK